jgi:hypothetical protein
LKFVAFLAAPLLLAAPSLAEQNNAPTVQQPSIEGGAQTNSGGTAPNAQPAAIPESRPMAPSSDKPLDPDDEVVCKRDNATGTRVSRQKICLTRRQWREVGND